MAILANQQTNKILKIKQTNKQTNLKILEAADIKLDLAVPSVSIYFLTRHTVDTLTFLQFLESTTIFCLGVFVLLCIFQKDSLLLLWPNPIHPAYYSPKITSSEGSQDLSRSDEGEETSVYVFSFLKKNELQDIYLWLPLGRRIAVVVSRKRWLSFFVSLL